MAEARLGELFNALPKATASNNVSGKAKEDTQIPAAGKLGSDELESEADEQGEKPKPKLEVAALVVDERRCSLPHFTISIGYEVESVFSFSRDKIESGLTTYNIG